MRTFLVVMSAALLIGGSLRSQSTCAQESGPLRQASQPSEGLSKEAGKQIAFELVIVERAVDLTATDKEKTPTAAQIAELEKQGKLTTVQRLKLVALENVESRLQIGEQAPVVTSRVSRPREGGFGGGSGFPGQESVSYLDVGSLISITARVEADGNVVARIHLARTGLSSTNAAEKVEGADPAISSAYPRKFTSTITTTTRIAPQQTVVLAGQQTLTGSTPTEFWVQVTAKVQ